MTTQGDYSAKPDEALVHYQIAKGLSPFSAISEHHLGHPYFVKRNFNQALYHYQKSLELQPQQETAHYFTGCVYFEQHKIMEAIEEFEKGDLVAAQNEAERTERKLYYDDLRAALQQGGKVGYWKRRLEIALGKPQPPLYLIATLYARLGDKKNAYSWLKQACEKKAFDQGLMFDLCWDHDDKEFREIAKGIGLLQ